MVKIITTYECEHCGKECVDYYECDKHEDECDCKEEY